MIKHSSNSGKFVLRVGSGLHQRLASYAQVGGLSLNSACVELLEKALGDKLSLALPFGLERLIAPDCFLAKDVLGIIVYGSWARGEASAASDIDVLVVLGESRQITRALYAELDQLLDLAPKVSVMLSHLPAADARIGSLWLEVSQDGMLLYDREKTVARRLAEIRREITSGRVIRRESHGQGYWVYA